MIIRLDGTTQMAQEQKTNFFIEVAAVMNEDGTINMNATQTKINNAEQDLIVLWGDGE
jgi:hypothetical protein|tara:strand:+ start:146 stop:319 length:174 start_codon:yes stop_codon:yes gene_type:complete